MPLYEYQCDACGRRFELIRKFSDPPVETCPHCGGPVHKLFSSPAIQFKGSGFYITDYAKKDHTPAGSTSDSKTESPSKEATEKSSDKSSGEKIEKSEKADKPASTTKEDKPSAKPDPAPSKS